MSRHLSASLSSFIPSFIPSFFPALFLALAASALGCGPARTAGSAVIDCVAADRAKIDALIVDLGTKTRPDGTRDWAAIEADAIGAGVAIGGCALAEFVESYLAPSQGVKAPSDGLAARQTLEDFRATKAGGATFKTQHGAL